MFQILSQSDTKRVKKCGDSDISKRKSEGRNVSSYIASKVSASA